MLYTTKSSKVLAFLYREAARLRGEVDDWENLSENSLSSNERTFREYAANVYRQLAEVVEEHIKNCHEIGSNSSFENAEVVVSNTPSSAIE